MFRASSDKKNPPCSLASELQDEEVTIGGRIALIVPATREP